uniref:Photosystem I assembly protein Ycf37 n=1 Tax=Chondria sp. (in: red algae) TaxID=1982705 RepID=A0A1Z1MQ46_9FLOR|nr:hypothetical protein [Chondria sp. (in: red algae)]
MFTDVFLFRSYIVIALSVLIPLSFIITLQIYYLLRRYILIDFLLHRRMANKKFTFIYDDYNKLFNLFLDHQKFFLCISSVELCADTFNINTNSLYILLAYCYQKSYFLYIAEYYYLKALDISPNSQIILQGLAKIYSDLGKYDKLNSINSQIETINCDVIIQ